MSCLMLPDVTAVETHAADWAKKLSPPGIIFLHGELGSGKTTWVRGFLRALQYEGIVKSPTYTLVEPYTFSNCRVYHFDLYRISDPQELSFLGVQDYFSANSICIIEWAEQAEALLPPPDLRLRFHYHGEQRQVTEYHS